MTRSELIIRMAQHFPQLSLADLEKAVLTVLDAMSNTLRQGLRVELRGFGALGVKDRMPRRARNPRTGDQVEVGRKRALYFKPGKELRARVNDGN